ncbi:MAG: PIG-L family deacetylase [Bryobacterales bacterium]|nr:PIG-L family deacetylase [Bryobacterales bacterium]
MSAPNSKLRSPDKSVLVIVSHPDDETLGCAHLLLLQPAQCHILHTTTGAPAEERFWRQAGAESREEYAVARRKELLAAMEVFAVAPERLHMLPFGDRDLPRNLATLVHQVHAHIEALTPGCIYTHAFEGGHPDHDSTRYAVGRALEMMRREGKPVPELREFTGYHARGGEFFSGAFLDGGVTAVDVHLDPEEMVRKRRALDCYYSQQRVIQRFALSPERWRPAPAEDFRRRPHEGPLYYEIREMGYRFEEFAGLTQEADASIGA